MSNEWWMSGDVETAWPALDVDVSQVDEFLRGINDHFRWEVATTLSAVKSPIERKLLLGLIVSREAKSAPKFVNDGVYADTSVFPGLSRVGEPEEIRIECQKSIATKYLADFFITWKWRQFEVSVAVEADGHDFHEKTKQQAAHDKKRDRAFAAAGVTVLRFTGSEIHRSPINCADEVYRLLKARLSEASRSPR